MIFHIFRYIVCIVFIKCINYHNFIVKYNDIYIFKYIKIYFITILKVLHINILGVIIFSHVRKTMKLFLPSLLSIFRS